MQIYAKKINFQMNRCMGGALNLSQVTGMCELRQYESVLYEKKHNGEKKLYISQLSLSLYFILK
jgi:hypothetical protein